MPPGVNNGDDGYFGEDNNVNKSRSKKKEGGGNISGDGSQGEANNGTGSDNQRFFPEKGQRQNQADAGER